jgi:hypothetical protein
MFELHQIETFVGLLGAMRNARRNGTRAFSYRQLADRLGYRSPRTLAMVHKGQRPPSRALVSRIVQSYRLDRRESELVTLLAEKAVASRRNLVCQDLDRRIYQIQKSIADVSKESSVEIQNDRSVKIYLRRDRLHLVQKRIHFFLFDVLRDFENDGTDLDLERTEYVLRVHIFEP